jgi:hypothetical protein
MQTNKDKGIVNVPKVKVPKDPDKKHFLIFRGTSNINDYKSTFEDSKIREAKDGESDEWKDDICNYILNHSGSNGENDDPSINTTENNDPFISCTISLKEAFRWSNYVLAFTVDPEIAKVYADGQPNQLVQRYKADELANKDKSKIPLFAPNNVAELEVLVPKSTPITGCVAFRNNQLLAVDGSPEVLNKFITELNNYHKFKTENIGQKEKWFRSKELAVCKVQTVKEVIEQNEHPLSEKKR